MISNDILFDGSNDSLHMRNHLKIHDGTHDDFLIGGGDKKIHHHDGVARTAPWA
jgi:hypothetical protein